MTAASQSLTAAAVLVLETAAPEEKTRLSAQAAAAWASGTFTAVGTAHPPPRPARPPRPVLRPPREVPRRRLSRGTVGRGALLHALAHIELNAVDLAWDLIARFAAPDLPRAFFDDWVRVARDEARHFDLLSARLAALDLGYGDLPAHDGLWEAARATADDLLARLAVVPMVLEARGLDVTPAMIERLRAVDDEESAAVLETIYKDEIIHVAVGRRWFQWLAEAHGLPVVATWQALVRERFPSGVKAPLNHAGRDAAGLPKHFYQPLIEA